MEQIIFRISIKINMKKKIEPRWNLDKRKRGNQCIHMFFTTLGFTWPLTISTSHCVTYMNQNAEV